MLAEITHCHHYAKVFRRDLSIEETIAEIFIYIFHVLDMRLTIGQFVENFPEKDEHVSLVVFRVLIVLV